MDIISDVLTWHRLIFTVALYYGTVIIYRLFLHPLSRFPGPKLAAVSRWYEGYYDVIQNGQYTFKIGEMHQKYGPIIRISPHELHVNDLAFVDQLYRLDGVWDKYDWSVDAFATYGAILLTPQHEIHKARRQPLNRFFSKPKVYSQQGMINGYLDKLCARVSLMAEAGKGKTFNIGAAITAFTRDVAFDYLLGKSYQSLEADDFDEVMLSATRGSGQVWRVGKHLRFVGPILTSLPFDWVIKSGDHVTKIFFQFLKENYKDTAKLAAAERSLERSNMVHEIMDSTLPASEKSINRIFDDVAVTTGAGFETTAGALRVALFHVFNNDEILRTLQAELATVNIHSLTELEQLPYLKAVLMEGLRMSPALSTRLSRIARSMDLIYKEWRIPAGTPVGMTLVLLNLDEHAYPEPRRFNPDRWVDPKARTELSRNFAPFLKGTRGCLGLHLAWAEMYLCMASLVMRFDFQWQGASAEDMECDSDQFAVSSRSKGVLKATVSLRDG